MITSYSTLSISPFPFLSPPVMTKVVPWDCFIKTNKLNIHIVMHLINMIKLNVHYLSCFMTKQTKSPVHPAKTQISLGIHPIWSESLPCTQWVAKDPSLLHADSEDSDQTGWKPRLIWVFAGHKGHFVGFVMRRLTLFCTDLFFLHIFQCQLDIFVTILTVRAGQGKTLTVQTLAFPVNLTIQ